MANPFLHVVDESVFRCPTDQADEGVPFRSLAEWARGYDEAESPLERSRPGYRPGEIVRFDASVQVGEATVVRCDDGGWRFDGDLPEGASRFVHPADFELQAESAAELFKLAGEGDFGAVEDGRVAVLCFRDWVEYWRAIGRIGKLKTYDFEPASIEDAVEALYVRLHRVPLGLIGHSAPVSTRDLNCLLADVLHALAAARSGGAWRVQSVRPASTEAALFDRLAELRSRGRRS